MRRFQGDASDPKVEVVWAWIVDLDHRVGGRGTFVCRNRASGCYRLRSRRSRRGLLDPRQGKEGCWTVGRCVGRCH